MSIAVETKLAELERRLAELEKAVIGDRSTAVGSQLPGLGTSRQEPIAEDRQPTLRQRLRTDD